MSFDYNGSTCTFPILVVAPSGVMGQWRADDFECSGAVIGAGFYVDLQVLPTFVSFEKLRIMEETVQTTGRWGCFQNFAEYPSVQFDHTEARGARRPLGIDGRNMIKGYDQVQVKLGGYPSEDGGYTLNIPLKWGIDGGPYCYDVGHAPMTVRVQTDGKVTVSKFGITRGRTPYGLYEGN